MIKQQHTYQLAKRGKWICPECRHKTFVCYVDTNGQILDEKVGKCDRADKCAYHYPPRQYFEDNKTIGMPIPQRRTQRPIFQPQPRPTYIDKNIFKQSVTATMTHPNNLISYLKTIFDQQTVNHMIQEHYIGTSKHFGGAATVFYQVDQYGNVHRGKVMQYNPTNGKRVKEPYPMLTTVHKLMKLGDNLPPQCLFGEHLLTKHQHQTIAIVESEKTAVIANTIITNCTTLACGGCGNLTPTICQPLRGRDVILFPDNGKYQEWTNKAKQMRPLFNRLFISQIMEQETTNIGDDIGDLFLQRYPDIQQIDFALTEL